ncbi:MAG: helix-turn-helix domain-containing protein [Eubacterium sp.]|nr:helix-turn-helix domain-containing protein [Eubacterium sp.]
MTDTLRALLYEYSDGTGGNSLKYNMYFFKLLSVMKEGFIDDNAAGAADEELSGGNRKDSQKALMEKYLRDRNFEDVPLEGLAEYMKMSVAYTSKLFKKLFGMNYGKYIVENRLVNACAELEVTDRPLVEVAMNNGFPSVAAFIRAFKEKYNETPGQHRSKHILENSANRAGLKESRDFLKKYYSIKDLVSKESEKISVDVDLSRGEIGKIDPSWGRIMTIHSLHELLNIKIQGQILELTTRLEIKYLRIEKLIDMDALHITTLKKGTKYNFSVLDRCLDFLSENGLFPYFCLQEDPADLYTKKEYLTDGMTREDYSDFIESFLSHSIRRYGITYLKYWIFDLCKKKGSRPGDFYEFYKSFYEAIKQRGDMIKTGAFGYFRNITEEAELDEILSLWSKYSMFPDFFSISAFDYLANTEQISNFILKTISFVKKKLRAAGRETLPIIISEWNETYSDRVYINDGCNRAAYIIGTLIGCINEVWAIVYDKALDASMESFDSIEIINGNKGMVTRDGIKKPAFYSFEMMHNLGRRMITKGANYIVTEDEDNKLCIVMHNYKRHRPDAIPKIMNNTFSGPDDFRFFENTYKLDADIYMRGLPYGRYRVVQLSMNTQNGSIYHEWQKMNFISEPSASEIRYLDKICMPGGGLLQNHMVTDGRLNIHVSLEPFEISQLIISRY